MLCISPKGPEHLHAGRCSLRHYPRYPWEQRGSDGNYTGVIEQGCLIMRSQATPGEGTAQPAEKEVQHKNCPTASPSSQGKLFCTQLRYACVCCRAGVQRETVTSFFSLLPTFSPGWEVDSLWTLKSKQTGAQGSVELYCEIHQ